MPSLTIHITFILNYSKKFKELSGLLLEELYRPESPTRSSFSALEMHKSLLKGSYAGNQGKKA